eukprot:1648046-Rhodomonas_salina.2
MIAAPRDRRGWVLRCGPEESGQPLRSARAWASRPQEVRAEGAGWRRRSWTRRKTNGRSNRSSESPNLCNLTLIDSLSS